MSKITKRTYWDEESQAFVTECKEYMNVIGCGATKKEAEKEFQENLIIFQDSINKGNALIIKNTGGRPKKNNVPFHCNIDEETKKDIDNWAKHFGGHGKTVKELVAFYKKHSGCELV